ncbi:hypothetical protein CTZ27_36525 [Streptomyces griseocarneus]|nr:hypothetical protein CTZ27_36525 [Streptomyces griseocarneus]
MRTRHRGRRRLCTRRRTAAPLRRDQTDRSRPGPRPGSGRPAVRRCRTVRPGPGVSRLRLHGMGHRHPPSLPRGRRPAGRARLPREPAAPRRPVRMSSNGLSVWDGTEDLRGAGLARDPEPWEDGLRETPRPGTFEWWYFDVECDDGTCVVIVFETKALSASAGPLAPRLSLTIRTPDGHVRASRTRYDPGRFRAARDHCDVVLGPHRVRGDLTRYSIHVRTSLAAADLTLTATAPPSRVGTGIVGLAEDPGQYLGWLVAVPRGTVEGRLTVGRRTWRVRGLGYHDKNWGTLDFGSALQEWHWARVHADEFTVACAELRAVPAHSRGRAHLFVLTEGAELRAATGTGVSFTPHATMHPHCADIRWTDRFRVTLGEPRDLKTHRGNGSLPYRRFTAPAEVRLGAAAAVRKAVGTAVAEHVLFRPATRPDPPRRQPG